VGVTFNTVSVRTSHTKPVGRNSRFLIRIHAKFCHVFSVMRHETVRSAIHSFLGITAPVRNLTVGKWARGIMDLERATKRCKVTTVYMVLIRRWGGGGRQLDCGSETGVVDLFSNNCQQLSFHS
jgi:hypothetical protein